MHRTSRRLPAAVVLSILTACSGAGDTQNAQQPAMGLPEGHPPLSGQAVTPADGPGGVVLETLDGGGYTYVRLGAGSQEIWVAGPVTALEVGDSVSLANPMPMGQFTSRALDRTFDELYFADGFTRKGEEAAAAGTTQGVVAETMNAGGYTYVRVDADGKDLWLAGPQTEIAEGDRVRWSGGMLMRGFTSNSLSRTFDEILFVNEFAVIA